MIQCPGQSTGSQILVVYHDLLDAVASSNETGDIYLDLPKQSPSPTSLAATASQAF